MKNLLIHLHELMSEFTHFQDNACKIFRSSFDAFDPQEKRLDNFSNDIQIHKYESLSYVIWLILTLSHGHASVERGSGLIRFMEIPVVSV